MAGELVASVVVKQLVIKLGSWLGSEVGLLWNFNNDLEDMKSTLESIEAVLNDAEKRSFKESSVCFWLKRLKAAAYDMEDMLDKLPTQNQLLYFPIMAHKLKGMRKRLDKIAEERSRYNLIKEEVISYEKEVIEERKTSSVVFKDDVLGREQEATQIINRLLMSTTTNQSTALSIIPIVGIGGLGKTTLAKLIFNDCKIEEGFELRIWVHAADFNVEKLAEAILSSAGTGNGNRLTNLESKMKGAQKVLDGKKFLIVLDDVWNEDGTKWEAFKQILQGGKKESKILVTTRSERVSSIMDATETQHKLKPLSYDVCLELFERRAFGSAGIKGNHLASIGKEIVKKCQGVPLTANSLGGILHFERGEAAWEKVRDSDLWELKEQEDSGSSSKNEILPSLNLSYHYMPSSLKLCFVYCSSYPRYFSLQKDTLIQQWIAQRFIQTKDEVEALQIGDGYVNYLLSMSFLEEEETYMKMHDLVYDLARWVAGDEVSDALESGKYNAMECRYASVINYNEASKELLKALPRKVRALHFQYCRSSLPKGIFSHTKCLRVLDFSGCSLSKLPTSIYRLKQLRYLRLPDDLKEVDERIGKLYNLIYLEINDCDSLSKIPNSIGRLQRLNSLKLDYCRDLTSLPESLGDLVNLVTLDIISCPIVLIPNSIGSLQRLNSLKLADCRRLTSLPESLGDLVNLVTLDINKCPIVLIPNSIESLQRLNTLKLADCRRLTSLPESLGNLVNLVTLDIISCPIVLIPNSIGSHQRLNSLKLADCHRLTSLPESLGNLVNLVTLDIISCPIVLIPNSIGSLQRLNSLKLADCRRLTSLPESLGDLVNLVTLDINKCPIVLIPNSIESLQRLNTLKLADCRRLTSLPESLGDLVNLVTLDINNCSIITLPASIGKLQNLIDLDLSFSYELLELPHSIGELQKLNSLKLYRSYNLGSLPESLFNLIELRTLDIRSCAMLDLDELHKAICNMRHLKLQRDEPTELLEFDMSEFLELHLIHSDPEEGHVVRNVTDAKRINLKERGGSIKSLSYQCSREEGRAVEAMLEALQPHQNLQELCIYYYKGSMFPSWMMSQMESFLPNLVKITLKDISNCEHLPVLGQLPKLKEIIIDNMWVRRISEKELCGARNTTAGASFPSLKRLELQGMRELEEWVTAAMAGDDGERGASLFPCLEHLTIWYCPKLRRIHPCIPPSVRRLTLLGNNFLHLLTFLDVPEMPLKHLIIYGCSDLGSFPESIRRLTSLETLALRGCKKLTTFPEWLGELSRLQHLEIYYCPLIDRLPQSIQRLTALKRLRITRCSKNLLKRTRKETGEDWDKISHIDNIQIR